jgi:hypothetical protein
VADFPPQILQANQEVISSYHAESVGVDATAQGAASSATAWPVANTAVFVPFMVYQPFIARTIFIISATPSGNLDMGVYDDQQNRLASLGSTVAAGTNTLQTGSLGPVTLNPGQYYMALNFDNAVSTLNGMTITGTGTLSTMGCYIQAVGAVTLPNPATFASPGASSTVRFVPCIGITTAAVL